MTAARALPVGWGAFLLVAIGAALLGSGAQLAFAALAIGVLGLPHGAGDLAVVAPGRRPGFLLAYLGSIVGVLLVWAASPVLGLGTLLACSGVHFALDDAEQTPLGWARGACLVAVPAVLHRDGVTALFADLTHDHAAAGGLAAMLGVTGAAALAIVVGGIVHRRVSGAGDGVTLVALAVSAVLPPLVGFSVGFVMLHARRQTLERQRALGCPTVAAYLRRVAPLLAGAAAVLAGIAVLFAARPAGDVGILFAGIAALAMPHMLVTPLWSRRAAAAPRPRRRTGAALPL